MFHGEVQYQSSNNKGKIKWRSKTKIMYYHTNHNFMGRSRRDTKSLSRCIISIYLQNVSNSLYGKAMTQNSSIIREEEFTFHLILIKVFSISSHVLWPIWLLGKSDHLPSAVAHILNPELLAGAKDLGIDSQLQKVNFLKVQSRLILTNMKASS